MRVEKLTFDDPVVLLEGRYNIAMAFGSISADGTLTWLDKWVRETTLPQFVRINVRDRGNGLDVLAGMTFAIHADAPSTCADAQATPACLARAIGGPIVPPASEGAAQ